MSPTYTYANPVLSLWQAAAAEVQSRQKSIERRMAIGTSRRLALAAPPTQDDPMAPVRMIGDPIAASEAVSTETLASVPLPAESQVVAPMTVTGMIADCTKTAEQFLWAEMTGNHHRSGVLAGELKDSECGPGWVECVATYLGYTESGARLPYRPYLNPVIDPGAAARLAIIGDWGNGRGGRSQPTAASW